jgi:hypothetical protein
VGLFVQISEVVNSMKDLIDFSRENKIGPIGKPLWQSKKKDVAFAIHKFQLFSYASSRL